VSDYGHWDVSLVGNFNPNAHLGFVYQITRIDTGKAYIGCKHLWKFKKGSRKRVKASEWRTYCSSSSYLVPEIKELGKDKFKFEILMLCDNKRNLYYNEMKLQVELGVLENDNYYNANVGGMRFYRPVKSYISEELRDKFRGTNNPAYRGTFYVFRSDSSIVEEVIDTTMKQWCKENGYDHRRISDLRNGKQKRHKDIIKVEYANEREDD